MVLLQVPISGYDANGRLTAVVQCPFYGRYKVRLLNYITVWGANPNVLLRVNSQDLLGNFTGSQLIITSNGQSVGTMNANYFEFLCDKLNGIIDVDLTQLDGTIPAGLQYALLNFDFEKVDER